MKIAIVAALIGLAIGIAAGAAGLATPSRELLAMTPADFQRTAAIKDDALETAATITTEPGYQERHGLLRIVWSDNFLRAFVDKTTGAVTYQLYQTIVYGGRYYRYYDVINYETASGPRSVETVSLGREERCSRSVYLSGCTRLEILGVPIDEALLKSVAADYAPDAGESAGWHFRFKAQNGEDYDCVIVPAEAAGLLAAVTAYRTAHGTTRR